MSKRAPITFDLDDGAYAKRPRLEPKKRLVEEDDDLLAEYEDASKTTATPGQDNGRDVCYCYIFD